MRSAHGLDAFSLPAVIVVAVSLAAAVWLVVDDAWWSDGAGVAVFSLAVVVATLLARPSSRVGTNPRRGPSAAVTLAAVAVAAGSLGAAVWLIDYERAYGDSMRLLNVIYEPEPWWSDPAAVIVFLAGVVAAGLVLRKGRKSPPNA
jgi:hypothetical protein